jgi:hypothetical protein
MALPCSCARGATDACAYAAYSTQRSRIVLSVYVSFYPWSEIEFFCGICPYYNRVRLSMKAQYA